jgi:hypothetical protein
MSFIPLSNTDRFRACLVHSRLDGYTTGQDSAVWLYGFNILNNSACTAFLLIKTLFATLHDYFGRLTLNHPAKTTTRSRDDAASSEAAKEKD